MESWLADENNRRQLEFGCPIFPPSETVFVDGAHQYFATVAPVGADLDEIRRLNSGELRYSPIMNVTIIFDVLRTIVSLLFFTRNRDLLVAITKAPIDSHPDQWEVVHSELVPARKDMPDLRLCELLNHWAELKETRGW